MHLSVLCRWSPAGKGLHSWPSCVCCVCFYQVSIWCMGQVWYLIVSVSDLCLFLTLWRFRGGASFVDPFSYLCFMIVFVMLLFLSVAAWERADLLALLCVVSYYVVITFPYCHPGQVWFLIVSMFFLLFALVPWLVWYILECKLKCA